MTSSRRRQMWPARALRPGGQAEGRGGCRRRSPTRRHRTFPLDETPPRIARLVPRPRPPGTSSRSPRRPLGRALRPSRQSRLPAGVPRRTPQRRDGSRTAGACRRTRVRALPCHTRAPRLRPSCGRRVGSEHRRGIATCMPRRLMTPELRHRRRRLLRSRAGASGRRRPVRRRHPALPAHEPAPRAGA
jgi:hypothetical protein